MIPNSPDHDRGTRPTRQTVRRDCRRIVRADRPSIVEGTGQPEVEATCSSASACARSARRNCIKQAAHERVKVRGLVLAQARVEIQARMYVKRDWLPSKTSATDSGACTVHSACFPAPSTACRHWREPALLAHVNLLAAANQADHHTPVGNALGELDEVLGSDRAGPSCSELGRTMSASNARCASSKTRRARAARARAWASTLHVVLHASDERLPTAAGCLNWYCSTSTSGPLPLRNTAGVVGLPARPGHYEIVEVRACTVRSPTRVLPAPGTPVSRTRCWTSSPPRDG